jgi:hypothetical protein
MKDTQPNLVPVEHAACYQAFFNLMYAEHDLTLTISEMDEIIAAAIKVIEKKEQLKRTT